MKQQLLRPLPSLALLACLLAFTCGLGRAQQPVAERLDVFSGETKLLPIDGPIDSFTVAPENIIKVDKSDTAPSQLNIVPLAGGTATLTIKSSGRTLIYDVAVSPAPVRLYINLNESQRLTFPNPIDDSSLSQQGIVRVIQPDTSDKVLLVEARTAGKTTLTVYSNKEIYRYFISTFENRGADVLAIQNSFSAKGYRSLTITFDKDQAIIGGSVPTQEELDDAVRIVKQYTDYVIVKAQLGQLVEQSEFTEQEQIIINNIQRIANVKGLTVRVKFPMPSVKTTSTSTQQVGDYISPAEVTTPQGGTVRGSGFLPPTQNQQQGPGNSGPTEPKPLQNVTKVTETSEDTSVPEKIFLYGEMQDDLDEARVIRVSRTFCPFIVNFLTVKDPIQIRTQIRFMQVTNQLNRDTGVSWTGTGPESGPAITLGFGKTSLSQIASSPGSFVSGMANFLQYGVTGTVDATAQLELYENLGLTKMLRESQLFLTNGQPGWYSEGEVKSYVASSTITASSPPIQTEVASSIFLGVNLDISPLNLVYAGGKEPDAQKILGIPASIGGTSGAAGYTLDQDNGRTADKVGATGVIQEGGSRPFIDNSVKYVDENGLIGMNISAQLTIPNGSFKTVPFGTQGQFITLPDVFVRTTRTRVSLRDGQTVAINGLIDEESTRSITSVPFLSKIPIFSALFKNPVDNSNHEEVIVLVTPHIVRMRDPDSSRYPKPRYPDTQDIAGEHGDIPILKPVRYDAKGVDIRPETPTDTKDAKDAKSDTATTETPEPLAPHATGGMENLQPAATPATAVDKKPASPAISQQPSVAPLAPSSTLP